MNVSIGISCGGPLDSARGVVLSPPNLPGWDEVPVTQFFADRFGIPARLPRPLRRPRRRAVLSAGSRVYRGTGLVV